MTEVLIVLGQFLAFITVLAIIAGAMTLLTLSESIRVKRYACCALLGVAGVVALTWSSVMP